MRITILFLLLPTLLCAQDFQFDLKPDAFPVEINGWQPFQPWAGGLDTSTPEFCDIDGDGDLDYFSGCSWYYYWFFENTGTATTPDFQYVTFIFDSLAGVGIGVLPESSIAFGDIDDDGDQDAFVSNGIIGLATNEGDATQWVFDPPPDTLYDQYGDFILGIYFDLVDIDGDGDLDLMGGWQDPQEPGIRYYQNVGSPQQYSFSLITINWQNIQIPELHQHPCFGDLDGDGDLDLLVGTGDGNIYYYRNDGDSTNPQMTYVTDNYFGIDVGLDASPELADIDADGDLDLFVGCSPAADVLMGDVYFYENIGTPQVPDYQFVTANYLVLDSGSDCAPRLIDIDADGDPDLLTPLGSHIALFRNQGSLDHPYFVYETDNFGGITVYLAIVPWFCDIDADGDYDLFIGPGTIPGPPGLQLYINRGTPQEPSYVLYSDDLVPGVFNQGSVVLSPATADIDADGDDDLFVSDDNGLFYFFENVGTATNFQFQFVTDNWQNIINGYSGHRYFCFYDIDDDQDLDLFYYSYDSGGTYLQFYRNTGSPESPQMSLENEDLFPEFMLGQAAPFLLDMDQDGDGDLFVGDTWGGIRYFENTIGDTLTTPRLQETPTHEPFLFLGPNPANPITWITYQLPYPQKAELAVYNLLGQKVATLASGLQLPGQQTVIWNAADYPSGVYWIRLQSDQLNDVKKVVVVK